MNNVDASVNKKWRLSERGAEAQLRGEALNAANRTMLQNPNTDQFNTLFGQSTATANYARQIQVVVRVSF